VIDEFRNEGKWVCVSDRPFVYQAIVLYRAKFSVLLFDVEEAALVQAF
jgi:hypothetical protein